MQFSERFGYRKVSDVIHTDEITDDIKAVIINYLEDFLYSTNPYEYKDFDFYYRFYIDYCTIQLNIIRGELDSVYNLESVLRNIHNYLDERSWYVYYELLEFLLDWVQDYSDYDLTTKLGPLIDKLNFALEKYNSGWRMTSTLKFIKLTEPLLTDAVDKVQQSPFVQAQKHIKKSIDEMSFVGNSDYNRVIIESINAVESCLKQIVDDENASLGKAVKELTTMYPEIDSDFLKPFSEIYGRISNNGMRHANGNSDNVKRANESEAILILTTCSALINYLSNQYKNKFTAK